MSLEERISELENEISEYRVQLNKAISENDRDREERFAGLINHARENLLEIQQEKKLLLQQQLAQQQTQIQQPPEPWIVLFSILPQWKSSMTPEQTISAARFLTEPTYDQLYQKCQELFGVDDQELFTQYQIFGVYDGKEYQLTSQNYVFQRGVHVKLIPRYYTYEFHIITLRISYSRSEVIKFCKNHSIAGSVTRDNTNSLHVSLHHPDLTYLLDFINTHLKPWLSGYSGYIDEENMFHYMNYGTLNPVVQSHKGTAKRDDGVDSWQDEDAKSGSTYFNAPIQPKLNSKVGSQSGSLASRMKGGK
mmetsp:Transcript_4435/g.4447  ORF Transcript_4435/g.4447 Transcript_4435/m.4447 type:complete len:306 (+) Transcript_4435:39-956(+)